MGKWNRTGIALIGAVLLWGAALPASGGDRYIIKVQASATLTTSPQIALSWDSQQTGVTVSIYRRILGQEGATWGDMVTSVTHPLHSYTDTSVTVGTVYEYKLSRPYVSVVYAAATAYICSGIAAPLAAESRGKVLIVTDETMAAPLAPELDRLALDMIGDGWTPIRRTYARHGTGTPVGLRALIQSEYSSGTAGLKSVCLVGKLPRLKSGYSQPDGHALEAQDADLFYSDMNGTWTDDTTHTYDIGTGHIPNLPGDGQYDQDYIPGDGRVELQLGRVDLADMTAWTKVNAAITEENLLRLYLDKDHSHRNGRLDVPRRGDYNAGMIGYLCQESSELVSLFGTQNTTTTAWGAAEATPWLGGVDFYNWNGAAYSTETLKLQFTINFGSGKQYWSNGNNQMRAMLAQRTYGLTCGWGSRPFWYFHQMGMGETIGYCAFRTQNNNSAFGDYSPYCSYWFAGSAYVNLMGDPTLRLHSLPPLTGLLAQPFGARAYVGWDLSTDPDVSGYLVYRADSLTGPYTRLTPSPIAATGYVDTFPRAATVYYMVRPVKLERATLDPASGTYWNAGTGAFTQLTLAGATNHPSVTQNSRIRVVTNTTLPVTLTGADPDGDAVSAGIVVQPAHGWVVGKGTAWTYIPDKDYTGPDRFRYMVRDGMAVSEAVMDVTVGPAPNTAPTASDQNVTCARAEVKPITLAGSDPDGDSLGFQIATQPQHGTLTGTPPAVVYQSDAAYSGPDTFTFLANDGAASSPAATVSITVTPTRLADHPTSTTPGLYCRHYTGQWTALPDYATLVPDSRTVVPTVSIAGQGPDNFGSQFYGFVEVPTTGTYTFYTLSDEGSRLFIGGALVVDNDGLHTATEASGQTALGQGKHAIRVDYFEATGPEQLTVNYDGPGIVAKTEIPASALSHIPNGLPVVADQTITMRRDAIAPIALTATDPEGGALRYGLLRPLAHGTLIGAMPNLYYAPAPGYVGTDSMRYVVLNAAGDAVAAEILIRIEGAGASSLIVH